MKSVFPILSVLVLLTALTPARLNAAESEVRYGRDIRPILADRCFTCHGPDRNGQENDLRLDLRDLAIEAAIVPGKSAESELLERLLTDDSDLKMPPPESGKKKITPEEVELIRTWIDSGATYEKHWAYTKPVRPTPPEAHNSKGTTHPIDRFVIRKLEKNALTLAEKASRRVLARRLHFDLIGLPPTMDVVEQFANNNAPHAYEELVDSLLDSDHFGERMAIYWLDLVRYADTIGYHSDTHRPIDAYRDYVIEAFNQNMPFDQFTIEQLAGDLLPDATTEQKIASGYNRLLQTTEEGGAQAKEYMAIYAADRVRNVSEVWLATTMGCCQCHDHKYDPVTTKEFYSFAAFFADIKERAVGRQQPNLKLPTLEQTERIASLKKKLSELESKPVPPEMLSAWVAELKKKVASKSNEWTAVRPANVGAKNGTTLTIQDDLSVLASGKNPNAETYEITVPVSEQPIKAIRLEALTHSSLTNKSLARGNGNFVLSTVKVSFKEGDKTSELDIKSAKADYEQPGWPIAHTLDNNPKTGWAGNGHQEAENRTAVYILKDAVVPSKAAQIIVSLRFESAHVKHNIGRFRVSLTSSPSPTISGGVDLPAKIVKAISVAPTGRTAAQLKELATYFKTSGEGWGPVRKEIADSKAALQSIEKSIRTTLVAEATTPRQTRVLPRGNWLDDTGEVVTPQTPARLGQLSLAPNQRATRLDLARWIVDKDNPLTARVFVNRVWMLLMGNGLARSLEDFGFQGEWPTHPELLDWLAVEFVKSDYDVKKLIKTIVMSQTYQQSSNPTKQLLQIDPLNQLLARQSSFRLDAEIVRDNALFVSGLLVNEIGGRSVKPYQPAGYWQHLNFPMRTWKHDVGDEQYRRGVYTYWCRSFLHPSLNAFDAPSREECTAKRPRSNTPLQALVLLNDPTYVEAAHNLAKRINSSGGSSGDKLNKLFAIVLQRPPLEKESKILLGILKKQRERYAGAQPDAKALTEVGLTDSANESDAAELAAWSSVCRVLLNLHETITRN